MSFDGKSVVNKAVSLNLCILLVLAIVGWNMGLSSAQCGPDGCPTEPSGTTTGLSSFKWGPFNGLVGGSPGCTDAICGNLAKTGFLKELPNDFKIDVTDNKGNIKISYKDIAGTSVVGTSTLSEFSTGLKGLLDTDGNLKIGEGDSGRKISLKKLPAGSTIKFEKGSDSSPAAVVYTIGKSEVRVEQNDVVLQQDDKGKITLKGYKIGEAKKDVEVRLGDEGKLSVDENGVLNYEGGASVIIGDTSFIGNKEKKGSVEFKGKGGNNDFIIKNTEVQSELNGKEYGLKVSEGEDGLGIYFGDGDKGDLGKRWLSLDKDGVLTGDLSELKGYGDSGEEVTFFNTGDKGGIKVDTDLFDLEKKSSLDTDGSVTFKKLEKGGETVGIVGTKELAKITPEGKSSAPGLPTTPIAGQTETEKEKQERIQREQEQGGGQGGQGGQGGIGDGGQGDTGGGLFGGGWLKWALIIGGGILAAMLLFGGGDDDKGGGEEEDDIDDGGAEFQGKEKHCSKNATTDY